MGDVSMWPRSVKPAPHTVTCTNSACCLSISPTHMSLVPYVCLPSFCAGLRRQRRERWASRWAVCQWLVVSCCLCKWQEGGQAI